MTRQIEKLGVPASPSGCQPSASAQLCGGSSQSGIPNAADFESYIRTGAPDPGFEQMPVPVELDARIDALWIDDGEALNEAIWPKELYANPAASQAMLDDPAFDVMEWLAQEIAREFAAAGATEFIGRPSHILRDPFTNRPFVQFYATRGAPSHAQAIEARRAATAKTGAVEDESAVRGADAPKTPGQIHD